MKKRPQLRKVLHEPKARSEGVSARAMAARARAVRPWFLYLIQCRNGAIYTGIALNVAKRFAAHVAGTGARYTRSNPPVKLLAVIEYGNQKEASRAEWETKQMTAADKRAMIRRGSAADLS
ncbi:MAG: GIY-YIG nuclease family protein [Betaproteobacteria bacterium]